MNDPSQEDSDPALPGATRASLKDEHAQMMGEVTSRAQAVTSIADAGNWPAPELRELLNYLHLELLRQLVDEEWLLFRVVRHAPEQLVQLRQEHLELRLAIELLDQAAASGGNGAGWSPPQLSATTRALLAQLERHLAGEDKLAISGDAAPATASFGAQPHEWYALTEGPVVDLDQLPGELGADAALARLMRLARGEQIEVRSSVDPTPLWQRLMAADPGGYGVTYVEQGPKHWRVQIACRPEPSTSQPYA
ncbi:MAG: hemerythrin domain-containing protein [Jatrophihabitans sp.]